MLSDERRREIAREIIQSHAEDVEYLSVREMTEDREPDAEREDFRAIDTLIRNATVVVYI